MTRSEQFFHGTRAEITGDTLTSADSRGAKTNWYVPELVNNSRGVVHSTSDEAEAWMYTGGHPHNGRSRVYAVDPSSDVRKGSHSSTEVKSESAKITGQIDTRPGYQGTFPTINWGQFGKALGNQDRFNHPDDDDVAYGHVGSALRREHGASVVAAYDAPILERRKSREPDDSQGKLF